ncbi:alpha/beta fold hydrolase [bacterium]|nr:alpha/beta fold hydrolase [bacterium]
MNKVAITVLAGLAFLAGGCAAGTEDAVNRQPVSQEMFDLIVDHYAYDQSLPLDPQTIGVWPHRSPYVIEKVEFSSVHGERVPAYFARPKKPDAKRSPAVLLLHGSNNFWGKNEDWALEWLDILAREGWCVLVPDFFGYGERKRPDGPDRGDPGPYTRRSRCIQAVTDQRRGLDYLCARPEVDPGKIALLGGSMGGYYGTLVAGLENRLAAVVLTVAGTWGQAATDDRFERFGHLLNFAPRIRAPVLMVNATGDGREPGEELFRAMPEPKQQIWYEHEHYLPPREYNKDIVSWLHQQLD